MRKKYNILIIVLMFILLSSFVSAVDLINDATTYSRASNSWGSAKTWSVVDDSYANSGYSFYAYVSCSNGLAKFRCNYKDGSYSESTAKSVTVSNQQFTGSPTCQQKELNNIQLYTLNACGSLYVSNTIISSGSPPLPVIDNTTYEVNNAYQNSTGWRTDDTVYVNTSLVNVSFNTTNWDANCSIGVNDYTYDQMIADDINTKCPDNEVKEHTCVLPSSQTLNSSELDYIYIACKGTHVTGTADGTSGPLPIVYNVPPTINSTTIYPDNVYTNTTLNGYCNASANNQILMFNYKWYKNNDLYSYSNYSDKWNNNTNIIQGLKNGKLSVRTEFIYNNLNLIEVHGNDSTYGYTWNGSYWNINSSIISGLSLSAAEQPTVYNDSGTIKLIAGQIFGAYEGYNWTGTNWVSDSSVINGLIDYGTYSSPTVFSDNGDLKLISGYISGNLYGYDWNGTSWVENSSIVNGLNTIYGFSGPSAYYYDSNLRLILSSYDFLFPSGNYVGNINDYLWNGTGWEIQNTYINDSEYYVKPTAFSDGKNTWLLSTNSNNSGILKGFNYDYYRYNSSGNFLLNSLNSDVLYGTDNWIFSCEALTGLSTSDWLNSSITTIKNNQNITYNNIFDDSTSIFPEIGDYITLSVNISSSYSNITNCYLEVYNQSSTTWEEKNSYILNNETPYQINMSYLITDWYNATYQNVTWRAFCEDNKGNINYTINQTFDVQDIEFPYIELGNDNSFNTNNRSIISSYLNNLTLQINFTDPNLFQASVNITCGTNGTIYYWENLNIPGNKYELNDTVSLGNMTFQQCVVDIQASDDHTNEIIPNYKITNFERGLKFTTENDLIVQVESLDGVVSTKTNKNKDRYNFDFEFESKELVRTFKLNSSGEIYPIEDGNYPGHFVIWNSKLNKGNWVDFNFPGSEDYNFVLNKITINEYEIIIVPIIEEIEINVMEEVKNNKEIKGYGKAEVETTTIFKEIDNSKKQIVKELVKIEKQDNKKLITENANKNDILKELINVDDISKLDNYETLKLEKGIDKFEFESIGGVNINNVSYAFYIGAAVNLSSINLYDNSGIDNWTVNVTTINAHPAWNGSATINGTWDWLQNVSNGTYQLEFTHPEFFSKTYNLEVTNLTQNLIYESSQTVHIVYVKNVKTGEDLTDFNISYNNLATNYNVTGNTSGYYITSYLDAGTYNYTIQHENYDNYTNTLTLSYEQTLNETIYLSFFATFILYDERTLELFDVNSVDTINFLLFCPNSTYTTLITDNTTTLPIDCNYTKFKFVLNYGASSYYRNFILTPTEALNVSVYLINVNTTDFIYNSFTIDDLLEDYNNPSIYIKKNIGAETIQITADYTDIENKIGAYLIENNEYIIEIHSDNNPIRVMGNYAADIGGEKSLRLYDINLNIEESTYDEDVYAAAQNVYDNATNESEVQAVYSDLSNNTLEVSFSVYLNRINSTALFTSTVYNNSNVEFLWNSTAYQNQTLITVIDFIKDGEENSYIKIVEDESKILLPIAGYVSQNFLNWFFTLLISVIAIMATIKTGDYVAVTCVGIGAFFVYVGWYTLSWSTLGLAFLISIVSVLKSNEKVRR